MGGTTFSTMLQIGFVLGFILLVYAKWTNQSMKQAVEGLIEFLRSLNEGKEEKEK